MFCPLLAQSRESVFHSIIRSAEAVKKQINHFIITNARLHRSKRKKKKTVCIPAWNHLCYFSPPVTKDLLSLQGTPCVRSQFTASSNHKNVHLKLRLRRDVCAGLLRDTQHKINLEKFSFSKLKPTKEKCIFLPKSEEIFWISLK